jgi:hypothetical protein
MKQRNRKRFDPAFKPRVFLGPCRREAGSEHHF